MIITVEQLKEMYTLLQEHQNAKEIIIARDGRKLVVGYMEEDYTVETEIIE